MITGLVCATLWAWSEGETMAPLSGLEWTAVFLLFAYFFPFLPLVVAQHRAERSSLIKYEMI